MIDEIIEVKLYSKGRLSISIETDEKEMVMMYYYGKEDSQHEGMVDIEDDSDYYYYAGNKIKVNGDKIQNVQVSKADWDYILKDKAYQKEYKIVKVEEDIDDPFGDID